ncbi:MAG: type 4a pilus biogenesis protein PilO [Candidatus Riflebacteria bacterium]|nr:type 4a pilus biogenesis protein PilO [Candidatus Riflebacteria bacterium]
MAEGFSLTEWLQKAKADPKVAAQPFLVLGAILFIGWKFMYSPQVVLLTKELKKNKGIESQIQVLEEAVANKEQIQLEVNEFRKARENAVKICYKQSEASQFLQNLRQVGKLAKMEIKSISPQPKQERTFETVRYEEYPVKISFQGTFSQLGIFLRLLEKQEKLIFLDLPPLSADASGTFKFDLLPTVYVLPEEFLNGPVAPPPPPEEGG